VEASAEGRQQQTLRFVVFAQQVLDDRRPHHRAAPQRIIRREQRQHLLEGVTALLQVARRSERHGQREQQLAPLRGGLVVGEQAQRATKPACGGAGRAGGGGVARLREHRHRLGVPHSRRALDVAGARGGRCAARRQHPGGPCVDAAPPAALGRLVHRASYDRVAKAEAPGRRRSHEVAVEELVHRREGVRFVHPDDLAGELRFERVAHHRRGPDQLARSRREVLELAGDHRGHGRGHASGFVVDGHRARLVLDPRSAHQLLQVERVPAALPVDPLGHRPREVSREERPRLLGAERHQLDELSLGVALELLDGGRGPGLQLPGPEGDGDEQPRLRRAPQQVQQQLDRRGISPVQIVERQHDSSPRGERVQQCRDRAVQAIAVHAHTAGCARRLLLTRAHPGGQSRKHAHQLSPLLGAEAAERLSGQLREGLIERAEKRSKGLVGLELRGPAGDRQVAVPARPVDHVGQELRLANAALARDLQDRRVTRLGAVQQAIYLCQLAAAANQPRARPRAPVTLGHRSPPARPARHRAGDARETRSRSQHLGFPNTTHE
jgi:hypothetical protein